MHSVRTHILRAICSRALLLAVASATVPIHHHAPPGGGLPPMASSAAAEGRPAPCRCVPDQWEGILSSTERELGEGQAEVLETRIRVHYDFVNKRFAMTDLLTGRRAVDDYERNHKYIIGAQGCFQLNSAERMNRMCLPDEARYLGSHVLGTDLAVGMWQLVSAQNTTMRTTILQSNCVPISEEIYISKNGYSSLTSSVYLDVHLGISDPSVFTPPTSCVPAAEETEEEELSESARQQEKRSSLSYSEIIRNHFLQ